MSVILDQSAWGLLRATGTDRARFLQGMLTNDVAGLAPGAWCRTVTLNVKGRVLALADVLNEGESFLLITEPTTGDKLKTLLEKHAIADDVELTRVELPVHRVWASSADVWSAPPVLAPPPAGANVDAAELEALRLEAGLPRYGVDVSEDYFPFEANLEAALSFQKGCYIGQEVVVRATTRGGAKKKLVGLKLTEPAAPGTSIAGDGKDDAGVVTSAVVSPRLGPIALAYLHHTLWTPGTRVQVGGREALVQGLPFPPG
jgi:folate-binding protein YgfZ